jgi:hypothetical protein
VIFHELGHCDLGLNHSGDVETDIQIMNAYMLPDNVKVEAEWWKPLLKQLFNRDTNGAVVKSVNGSSDIFTAGGNLPPEETGVVTADNTNKETTVNGVSVSTSGNVTIVSTSNRKITIDSDTGSVSIVSSM